MSALSLVRYLTKSAFPEKVFKANGGVGVKSSVYIGLKANRLMLLKPDQST